MPVAGTPGLQEPTTEGLVNQVILDIELGRSPIPPCPAKVHMAQILRSGGAEHALELIGNDVVFTQKLLRLASVTLDPESDTPLPTLPAALDGLGAGRLANLVEAMGLGDFVRSDGELATSHLRMIWTNMLYTAAAAEEIALWLGHPRPGEVFRCGLLHNAGEPMLVHLLARTVGEHDAVAFRSSALVMTAIRTNHELVGEQLLAAWAAPADAVALAARHHCPVLSEAHAIVLLAHQAALEYGYAYLDNTPLGGITETALKYLGLSRMALQGIPEKIGPWLNVSLSITR